MRIRKKSVTQHTPSLPEVINPEVFSALVNLLGADRVRVDGAERALLRKDASLFDSGVAGPVCFPENTFEVQQIVKIANRFQTPVVPRGAGTGSAGGSIPLGAPIVISLARMNRIHNIDFDARVVWVEPGVVNLDLTKYLHPLGFHFAPDPSSQQVCTIGGNVANNSGGPHCLAYGITNAHIVALEVVLPDGEVVMLGGLDAEPLGYDLRGVFIGGEGTLGIATRIAARITANAPAVRTMLMSFNDVRDAANTVSDVIAAGIVPAAMEVMDQLITQAAENYVHAGYPTDVDAILLAEVDGCDAGVDIEAKAISHIAQQNNAVEVRLAQNDTERALLWKGRKTAFGAVAQVAPDYYLHDTVVPRSRLAEVLAQTYEIAERHGLQVMNVFHAGDGNLHPLLLFDAREPGVIDRVHAAGADIVKASLAAGGVLSGEHGIGIEKQAYMSQMFTDDDLDHQNRLRKSFDPQCLANPGKVLPAGHSCADIQQLREIPNGVWV